MSESIHAEIYGLITRSLVPSPQGLMLSARGVETVAQRAAAASGEGRAEALLGVLTALDFLATQKDSDPARASVLAIFMTLFERAQLDESSREAFQRRLREVSGGSTETKLPFHGPRPEGTVAAGPAARFALAKPDDKPRVEKGKRKTPSR